MAIGSAMASTIKSFSADSALWAGGVAALEQASIAGTVGDEESVDEVVGDEESMTEAAKEGSKDNFHLPI